MPSRRLGGKKRGKPARLSGVRERPYPPLWGFYPLLPHRRGEQVSCEINIKSRLALRFWSDDNVWCRRDSLLQCKPPCHRHIVTAAGVRSFSRKAKSVCASSARRAVSSYKPGRTEPRPSI